MTLAQDLIAYIGGLTLTGEDHDAAPFSVLPWEGRFLRGAFRGSGDAALSVTFLVDHVNDRLSKKNPYWLALRTPTG